MLSTANNAKYLSALILLTLILPLQGCVKMMAQASDTPKDTDHGKRTFGSFIEDQNIENKTRFNIYQSDERFAESRIVVVSFNGTVLLTGQVESQDLKNKAEKIARQIRHVERVENELSISGPISFLAKRSDDFISAKIKTRFLLSSQVPGRRLKVKTENGVVYLMGLVTREEGQRATDITQKVYGVQKIVKIFEYI